MCFDKNYTFFSVFLILSCSIFKDQCARSSQAFLLYYNVSKKSIAFFDFFLFFAYFLFLSIFDHFALRLLCNMYTKNKWGIYTITGLTLEKRDIPPFNYIL